MRNIFAAMKTFECTLGFALIAHNTAQLRNLHSPCARTSAEGQKANLQKCAASRRECVVSSRILALGSGYAGLGGEGESAGH